MLFQSQVGFLCLLSLPTKPKKEAEAVSKDAGQTSAASASVGYIMAFEAAFSPSDTVDWCVLLLV